MVGRLKAEVLHVAGKKAEGILLLHTKPDRNGNTFCAQNEKDCRIVASRNDVEWMKWQKLKRLKWIAGLTLIVLLKLLFK